MEWAWSAVFVGVFSILIGACLSVGIRWMLNLIKGLEISEWF